MADEQTTIATAQNGTAQGDSNNPPATGGNTPQVSQGKPPAIDLEKELQKVKSQMGREVAAARREAEAARQQAQAIAQRDREQRLNGMDDLERTQYLSQEKDQHIGYLQQQLTNERNERDKEQAIAKLTTKYGVPREVIESATDYADAQEKAEAWRDEHLEERIAAEVEKRTRKVEANAPDLGGGTPSTASSRQDDDLRDAWKRKDAQSYVSGILKSRNK